MAAQNPFGVIGDEEFDLPGQFVRLLVNEGLETLNEQQFGDEFHRLTTLEHHVNILPYTGYNIIDQPDGEQVRLVFCQHQGISLDVLLPDFGWAIHYRVIKGITSGLRFLLEARPDDPIYHLDLRLSNIFCQIDMQPKIAFFGLSRLFARDQNLNVPGNVPRPYGYVAPEYQIRGEITDRSDVFGLGILMLAILTGQQFPLNNPDAIQGNIAQIRQNWSNVQQIQIRYPQLDDVGIMEVMGCIAIAIECLEINPNRRPSAGEINDMVNAGQPFDNNLMIYCINHFNKPPGNIGYMLSARGLRLEHPNEWSWHTNPGGFARLPGRAELQEARPFRISGEIATKHLILDTIYRVYLVYALAPNHSGLDGSEHRSAIQVRANVPEDQIGFLAGEEQRVRLVGPPRPDGPEPDVIYPVAMGDDGRMSLELGWFQVGPEHVQGPHAVIAQLSIVSGGGVAVRGLIVEGMEFRPF